MGEPLVSIIVDPEFGERLTALAERGPVWIADTLVNRPIAEAWCGRRGRPVSDERVTTFRVNPGAGPEEWVADILAMVELHHGGFDDNPPSYETLEVWGASLSPRLRDLLTAAGYAELSEFPGGFRAHPAAAAA